MNRKLTYALLALCLTLGNHFESNGQDSTRITFTGYVDSYFAYDFDDPSTKNRQFSNMAARHNEFNVNHAYFLGEYMTDKVRAVLGLQVGTYPIVNYGAEPSDIYRSIYQAYAGVKLSDKVWLDAGIFPGHTGYESVESLYNEVYTRAFSTEYTPYYLTGVRLTADLSEKVTLTAVVVNGWQNIAETNDSKSFGINLSYNPSDQLELSYGNYLGDEGDGFIGSRYRTYNNAYIKYRFSDKFHAVLSLDHGRQELVNDQKGTFYFITWIGQYYLSEKVSLAMRFEEVNDDDNILTAAGGVNGFSGQVYTFDFNYHITKDAMFRVESKFYKGSQSVFVGDGTPNNDNQLIAASIAVKI